MRQEELQKLLLERQKEHLAEQCVEQLAQLKEQLAEDLRETWGAAVAGDGPPVVVVMGHGE